MTEMAPTVEKVVQANGRTVVFCDACDAFLGYPGYGEKLQHSLVDCIKHLRRLIADA